MKGCTVLCMALALCFVGCSESLRVQKDTSTQTKQTRSVHTRPVIVALDEIAKDELNDTVTISANTAVVFSDPNVRFDQTAIIANRSVRSRAAGVVKPANSGQSQLIQRIYYTAGEVSRYSVYEYDETTGTRTRRIEFDTAGADLIWFNEDDDVRDYATFDTTINQVATLTVRYNGAGVDGIWFTEDDAVQRYVTEFLDANAVRIGETQFNAPGADGAWFTEDDVIQVVFVETTAEDGSMQWIQYNDAGTDGDWATLDDNTVGHFSSTVINADGLAERHIFYLDPGLDLIPFNTDDTVLYYHDYTYDTQARFTNSVLYLGPGDDMEWFTTDDLVDVCESVSFNADDTVDREVRAAAGLDLACFTTDDETSRYEAHVYDDTSHLTAANRYNDAGVDLEWFTTDDVLSRESIFSPL